MIDLRPGALWDRLRSTYWFVPSLMTVTYVVVAIVLTELDRAYREVPGWMGWAYSGGADGARALLSAIAGSTITVVSVTFSVMVVALTVSSQHFGPRLLSSFMRDTASQSVLGAFTGTFAYCLVVLRTVQGDGGDRYDAFIPHLAVTGSVLLTLVSVAMLIYYVHHVAMSMQLSEITGRVVADLEASIDRLYPTELGEAAAADEAPPPLHPGAIRIQSPGSGYIQDVNGDALMAVAGREKTTVWILQRPGSFIVEGQSIAAAYPPPEDMDKLASGVRRTFSLGADRTSRQDVAYAAQQLVEVALRALSPGVNEPFTAITCIDRLGQGLARLARRQHPASQRSDAEGRVRVIAPPRRFDDLAIEILEPIAHHASANPLVRRHLLRTIEMLSECVQRSVDRVALEEVAAKVRFEVS